MYNIGDKVVYPMHGAGVIDSIEEKEILGETHRYYVMRMPIGDMKVMIPMANVESLGIRQVISAQEARAVLNVLQGASSDMPQNWNRRYRANREKLRSGNIYDVAEVVRNLAIHDREKGLSTGERKMLENSRQILISELVLALCCTAQEMEAELHRLLN